MVVQAERKPLPENDFLNYECLDCKGRFTRQSAYLDARIPFGMKYQCRCGNCWMKLKVANMLTKRKLDAMYTKARAER